MELFNKFKKKPAEKKRVYLKYDGATPIEKEGRTTHASLALDADRTPGEPFKAKKRLLSLTKRRSLSGWLFVMHIQ